MSKPKYVVVDLDGTVADCTHRLHYIQGETKDWCAFYKECANDKPIDSMIDMVRALNERMFYIIFLTGRSEVARELTQTWLSDNLLWDYVALLMRPEGDYREDSVVKIELLNKFVETNLESNKDNIAFVLDDRSSVVKAFRKEGYKVLQVAEGDF